MSECQASTLGSGRYESAFNQRTHAGFQQPGRPSAEQPELPVVIGGVVDGDIRRLASYGHTLDFFFPAVKYSCNRQRSPSRQKKGDAFIGLGSTSALVGMPKELGSTCVYIPR